MTNPGDKLKPGPNHYFKSSMNGTPQKKVQRPVKGPTFSKMYQTISGLGHIKLRAVDPSGAPRPMSSINNA